jgi:hypothetical protein
MAVSFSGGPTASHWQTLSHNVVLRCKSNYNMITTTMAPRKIRKPTNKRPCKEFLTWYIPISANRTRFWFSRISYTVISSVTYHFCTWGYRTIISFWARFTTVYIRCRCHIRVCPFWTRSVTWPVWPYQSRNRAVCVNYICWTIIAFVTWPCYRRRPLLTVIAGITWSTIGDGSGTNCFSDCTHWTVCFFNSCWKINRNILYIGLRLKVI